MRIVGHLDLPDADDVLKRKNLELGGAVQMFIDSEVIRLCEPYVPFDKGVLTASAYTATDVGSGEVVYNTPYAHYQYYGQVYGPNIPMVIGGEQTFRSPANAVKQPTGAMLQYNKEVHPLAGSFWFERMKADHLDDLLRGAKKAAEVIE